MLRQTLALPFIIACLSLGGFAHAEDGAAGERVEQPPLPASAYPDRWCIQTFIAKSRKPSRLHVSRRAPAPTIHYRPAPVALARNVAAEHGDKSSLLNLLKALDTHKLMTLWQGRDRALVVGIQDGGYLGVSIDEATASVE